MSTPFSLAAILPFCAKNDPRNYLLAPYKDDGYVVASDACVAVRVSESLIAESVAEKAKRAANISALIEKHRAACAELPSVLLPQDLPKPKLCAHCNGTGKAHQCTACDGKGEFEYCGEVYVCNTCGGQGVHPSDGAFAKPETVWCPVCDGSGSRKEGADIGPGHFSLYYLNLLASLGEVCMFPVNDVKGAYFTFSHGDGVLMPLRRKEARHG